MHKSFYIDWSASNKKFEVVQLTFPHMTTMILSSHNTYADAEDALNKVLVKIKKEIKQFSFRILQNSIQQSCNNQ